ncbi:hypothetical protein GCM10009555_045900 [Acrocarpospora macrocephala]|uniref:HTH gntR-type domain-containing protein n=1 Tax=Acrocarpospora macrocephala TaxID=150177 RepID=A0A5M3WCG3_9ACTN|nr:hypothetical protein Amac_003420 [Acrocarpospora macrocephala]
MMPPERTELTPDAWSQQATIPPEIATPAASGSQPLPVRTGRDLRVPLSRANESEASPPTRTSRADPPSRADRNEARSPARTGGPHGAVIALRRREIIDNLAGQIASGELEEGARVTSVRRLMDAYSIPASAARSVQRELRDRRIIRLVPGLGYVVGAPDRTPKPPRIPVQDQITQIATSLAEKIASGQIGTHQPATLRGLMIEHTISREAASAVLSRLRSRGWAYDTPYQTTRAAPRHKWPSPGTSLTNPPPPTDHLPNSRRPKARPPPAPRGTSRAKSTSFGGSSNADAADHEGNQLARSGYESAKPRERCRPPTSNRKGQMRSVI